MVVDITTNLGGITLPEGKRFTVRLPRLVFDRAAVYVDGVKVANFIGSDAIIVPIERLQLATRPLVASIVLELSFGQDAHFISLAEPVFVATRFELKKFDEFMEQRRAGPNNQASTLSRIIIAIFALLLFLIIESSPEALGLALFMGFEAVAVSGSYGDLRRYWISEDVNLTFLIHYCNAMGDIFRLYFYLQLCRVTAPKPGAWLAWASVYAVIYGGLRHFEVSFGFPHWPTHHIVQRDLIVSVIGTIILARSAWHLRNKDLPWRVGALTLAAVAATAQGIGAAPLYFPFVKSLGNILGGYGGLAALINANSAYLFALSTFVNISTLENRVKVLSQEKARAEAMERELELGRSVQRAFLTMPSMPAGIGMSCHYEAAVYVSGDTYFVHWDEKGQILTFLMNDVTGHGIQAALKAFACNIIARSVWSKPWVRNDRRSGDSRLKKYDEAVVELICKDGETPDFNAMVGVEFSLSDSLIRLYRVNYSFPIIVEPNFAIGDTAAPRPAQAWTARSLSIPNQTIVEMPLKEGAFVLLISDGFMSSARDHRHFVDYLNHKLANASDTFTVTDMRQAALTWEKSSVAAIDDRTLLIFQWNPHTQAATRAA